MLINRIRNKLRKESKNVNVWCKHLWLKNPVRTSAIERKQKEYMNSRSFGQNNRAIIFLVSGYDKPGGGVMSILSLAEETERLKYIHGADVCVCTLPGHPALMRYTTFDNDRIILNFDSLIKCYSKSTEFLVHVPEIFVSHFLKTLQKQDNKYALDFRFNILLQNIKWVPERDVIRQLSEIGLVTTTTAHEAYSGIETEKYLGCPVHHYSIWMSPEQYKRKNFYEKKDTILMSPDWHENRNEIIEALTCSLPEFDFITIKGVSYQEYKQLIELAKFTLTFGEGLDCYFAETIFSGGIGCAIYNDEFFTKDFADVPFIYKSWDDLLAQFPVDVKSVNTPDKYQMINSVPYDLLCKQYSYKQYQKNIISFYMKYFCSCSA